MHSKSAVSLWNVGLLLTLLIVLSCQTSTSFFSQYTQGNQLIHFVQQSYSRGAVIPCHLSIHSKNTDALDTLASHEHLRVCLVRRIHLHEDPKQAYSRTQEVQNANGDKVPPGVIEQVDIIERAVWWPISSEEPDTRYLQGEIHLDEGLQPSSQFLLFKVSVSVCYLSFVVIFLTLNGL